MQKKEFKEVFAKTKFSKEKFISSYLNYLQNVELNVPVDIINSKVTTVDFLYVPFYIYKISQTASGNAEIGKNHSEWESEKTGRVKIEYEKNWDGSYTKYETPEEESVLKEYTTWSTQRFSVSDTQTFRNCANYQFSKMISTDSFLYDTTFKDSTSKPEKFKILSKTLSGTETFKACHDIMDKNIVSKIYVELSKRGDSYRNVDVIDTNVYTDAICLYIPIGYIEYTYGESKKKYYFVQSLYDEVVYQVTVPTDEVFCAKKSQNILCTILIFLLYLAFAIFAYQFVKVINLSFIKQIFYGLLVFLFIDYCSICYCYDKNNKENVEKRQQYIKSLFKQYSPKIKKMIISLNKPYEGIL